MGDSYLSAGHRHSGRRLVAAVGVLLATVALPGFAGGEADPILDPAQSVLPVCGDQDGSELPFTTNCAGFTAAPDVRTFRVPGAGPVSVRVDFVFREAVFDNELCLFVVDDERGSIGELQPGSSGYVAAALSRATVVFPKGSAAASADFRTNLSGGMYVAFFLIQGASLDALKTNNPTNNAALTPVAFFSFENLNPDAVDHFVGFLDGESRFLQFGFEDLTNGGDFDFDDVVYNVYPAFRPVDDASDRDGDGLLDEWEERFGLSFQDGTGDNGPLGDPDHDGKNNGQEQADGTHPRGYYQRYLAEGATGNFFDTRLAFLNPSATHAHTMVRFLKSDGTTQVHTFTINGVGSSVLDVETMPTLGAVEFSTTVESDEPVVVDRRMSWDATGYGSHAETAVEAPSTTWYFAEGATHSTFDLFYLVTNPNDTPVDLEVRYLLPSGTVITRAYVVDPSSRLTIWVDAVDPALEHADVGAAITSSKPTVVERAMYLGSPTAAFLAGHAGMGITQPATKWTLAEGATGTFFDLFVLVANPTASPAALSVDFLLPDGSVVTKQYEVQANSRFNIWVDTVDPKLADTAVSTVVTSLNDVPIIVERAMWWPGPTAATWTEAHTAHGVTGTARRWGVADGEVGGERDVQTFLLIANQGAGDSARVTLVYEDGTTEARVFPLPASSRTNVAVGADFPASTGRRFGAIVEALGAGDIVVERATYWNANGVFWAAGGSAVAARLP